MIKETPDLTKREQAVKAFETTKDPRMIDVLLDAGCFADMEEIAQTDPDPFFASYVEKKTDLVNLSIAARLLRTSEDTVSGMEEELLPGGSMRAVFLESIGEGKEAFVASLSRAGYAEIGNAIAGGASPSEIERMSDLILLDFTKEKADELYGPAIPAARLLTREAEIKNLRILSYGVESRIGGEEIRSRLRF